MTAIWGRDVLAIHGFRGEWKWEVMRRLPPDFRAQRVADGHADVKNDRGAECD